MWKKAVALALVLPTAIAFVYGYMSGSFLMTILGYLLGAMLLGEAYQLWKGELAEGKVKGAAHAVWVVAIVLLAGILVADFVQRRLEPVHDRLVRLVKEALKQEGIGGDVDPVVELSERRTNLWTGTATYGETVYDLSISKDPQFGWRVKYRRLR
jgi:hypothetical protein